MPPVPGPGGFPAAVRPVGNQPPRGHLRIHRPEPDEREPPLIPVSAHPLHSRNVRTGCRSAPARKHEACVRSKSSPRVCRRSALQARGEREKEGDPAPGAAHSSVARGECEEKGVPGVALVRTEIPFVRWDGAAHRWPLGGIQQNPLCAPGGHLWPPRLRLPFGKFPQSAGRARTAGCDRNSGQQVLPVRRDDSWTTGLHRNIAMALQRPPRIGPPGWQ